MSLALIFALLLGGGPASERSEDEVQALVDAARGGDRRSAESLYVLYAARLFRAVRPLCFSDAEAEDMVQDTFVKAFGALDRYQPRPGVRFVAWLSTLALNTTRKRARRRRFEIPTDPPERSVGSEQDTVDAADRARLRQILLEALDALPERDRQVVALRYGAELSAPEVAEVVGISAANVRKICERRRAELLQRLSRKASKSRTLEETA